MTDASHTAWHQQGGVHLHVVFDNRGTWGLEIVPHLQFTCTGQGCLLYPSCALPAVSALPILCSCPGRLLYPSCVLARDVGSTHPVLFLSVSISKMKNSLVLASKRFQGLIGECNIKHCPIHSMWIVSFLTIPAYLGETAGLASDHPSKRISR